jgi:superfamily II DNA/RNA helicase
MDVHLEGISKILEEVMILRTRSDISARYPDLTINNNKIIFTLARIIRETYEFPKTYLPIYENISDLLIHLHVPHISLINDTGMTLSGLYRVLLFKRLESSVFSFKASLETLREKEQQFLEDILEYGWDIVRKKKMVESFNHDISEEDLEISDWINNNISEQEDSTDISEDRVIEMVKEDIFAIGKFLNEFVSKINIKGKYSYDDPKLSKLKDILSRIQNKKILIFTQYVDTLEYLYKNLIDYTHNKNLTFDCVSGNDSNMGIEYGSNLQRERKIKLFSPRSNGYSMSENEREIDILLTTDALSEGVNLQDCSIVINYDLPWNPMRIVQRIGRIDRIGSTETATVFNIFPDKELDTLLDLIENISLKIINITRIMGKENFILSDDEDINPRVIGEKIKKIENAENYEVYETVGRNPFLKRVHGQDEKSIKMLEIKSMITRMNLKPEEFRVYSKTVYSIIKSDFRKGLFVMFRIYDKSKSDETDAKMENVLLYKDFRTNDIQSIEILDLGLEHASEGIRKSDQSIKYDLNSALIEIEKYFEKSIFEEKRSAFRKINMRTNTRQSRLQKYIVERLHTISNNQFIQSMPSDQIRQKAKFMLKEFREKILDQTTSDSIRGDFVSPDVKNNANLIQIMMKMENEEFINRIDHFYNNYIKDNPLFPDVRDERNIAYKIICWGALV